MDDLILWADKAVQVMAAILRKHDHDEIIAASALVREWDEKFEQLTWEKLNELGIAETHSWRQGASDEHHRQQKHGNSRAIRDSDGDRGTWGVGIEPVQNTGRQRRLF